MVGSIFTEISIRPETKDGEPTGGWIITEMKEDALLKKIGLKQGDIITKINGQAVFNILKSFQFSTDKLAFEIARKGKEMTIIANIALPLKQKEVKPGKPYIYKGLFPPWIINFPTKQDWRSVSKIRDIEEGLKYLVDHFRSWGVESLAVPPLGCGNGQLDWRDVGPLIYKMLEVIKIPVEMYAPFGIQPKMLTREFLSESVVPTKVFEKEKSVSSLNPAWLNYSLVFHVIYYKNQQRKMVKNI